MPYLGINFDTVNMKMSIPAEKIAELQEDLSLWSRRSKVSKKCLQELLGKLHWVSKCVKYSRCFMARLLNMLSDIHKLPSNKRVPIEQECKKDIKWWSRYLRRFNGVECIYPDEQLDLSLEELLANSELVICGDAQPKGGGAYFGREYWSRAFPEWLADETIPIHIKEFWVIIASMWLWGEKCRGRVVYVFCDNSAVVETLENKKPRDCKLQDLLREFYYIVCTRGFSPKFRIIGTKQNKVVDFLSRNHNPVQIEQFFKDNCEMKTQVHVKDSYFKLLSNW